MPRQHDPLAEPVLADGFFAGTPEGHAPLDPWAHLTELRSRGPLVWNEQGGWWLVPHHRQVQEVSVDPTRFSSAQGILVFEIGQSYASPPTMMHTDPPDHTRYRQLVAPAFRPSAMRSLDQRLHDHVTRLLDDVPVGTPVDIVEHLSVPFPLLVICELLGLPWEDWERLFLWSEVSVPGASDLGAEERGVIQAEMFHSLVATVKEKAANPGDDVFTLLAAAELSDVEMAMFAIQLLTAGNETVRNTISSGLRAFADHPEQWQRLLDDRSLIPSAVEEIVRWATPVIYFMRTAVDDTTLAGETLRAGDPVVLLYSSANRDEEVFGPTANQFDVGRSPNPHVGFGFGAHYCIGAALARLELTAVLDAMLDRYQSLEPGEAFERTRSSIIAGIRRADLVLVPSGSASS
jgi:cytochrome P450